MTPKRARGQCSTACHSYMASPERAGMNGHSADCPALYPLQRQPGDEKDALTRLVTLLRRDLSGISWTTPVLDSCLDFISEAREEHKTALREVGQLITALESEKARIRDALLDTQKRMGEVRQQALREATEDIAMMPPKAREEFLEGIRARVAEKAQEGSPTCTHDDAATPGHAERVKERGERFDDDAHRAFVSEATSHMHDAPSLASGPYDDASKHGPELREAYNRGAEAMRAACWEAAQQRMRILGMTEEDMVWQAFKDVIEDAAP